MGRWAVWVVALGFYPVCAYAQTYPTIPDHAHSSVAPQYSWQGPLPIQQQARPGAEVGVPAMAAPGVSNGLSVPMGIQRDGTVRYEYIVERDETPPPLPPSRTKAHAHKATPGFPDGLAETDFHESRDLPPGGRMAIVNISPTGGIDYWLLLAPGTHVPPNVADAGRVLSFFAGHGAVAVGTGAPGAAKPGARFAVPPRTPQELTCADDARCIVFVRTDGPMHVRWIAKR